MLRPHPSLSLRYKAALALVLWASAGDTRLARADDPPTASPSQVSVLIAVGAPGEEEFGTEFTQWATQLEAIARRGGAAATVIGARKGDPIPAREKLQLALANEPKEGTAELWLVLIGHGTFDGREAKFNLRGADVSASELQGWLQPFHRPLAIIDTTAASAPFLARLAGTNRVVVTATRSGSEANFTRFGKFFCAALGDTAADLDKDGQTSLLEAFLMASRQVKEFYEEEGRLVTEHALLDDNGDGLGTPPDWFRGIRATKTAKDGAVLDGVRAHQLHLVHSPAELELSDATRARRDELELSIARLREGKRSMSEAEYYKQLETLLLELARLYGPK